ncbi:MAG: hypothetical protein ABI867_08025 [Kofleriaceae bacterium]
MSRETRTRLFVGGAGKADPDVAPKSKVTTRDPWDPDHEVEEEEDLDADLFAIEQAEIDKALGWRSGPMPIDLHPDDPATIVVPVDATYEEVATALNGAADVRADWFEFIPPVLQPTPPENKKCVQVLDPSWIAAATVNRVREGLETLLTSDVTRTVDILKERFPGSVKLERIALTWAQRSLWLDSSGVSYFDRYLNSLSSIQLEQPHWYTLTLTSDTESALSWLFTELKDTEPLTKAIALRSTRWKMDYDVGDGGPTLNVGSIVGRLYFGGSHLRLYIGEHLGEATTRSSAIIKAENTSIGGPRLVIPRVGGKYYDAYSAITDAPLGPLGDDCQFIAYYPGTVLLWRFNETTRKGDEADNDERDWLGELAIGSGDPTSIYALDHDVLSRFDAKTRMAVFHAVVDGGGIDDWNGMRLLARLVTTTPVADFPALEKALVTKAMVDKLAHSKAGIEARMALGQAFTLKSIELHPSSLSELPDEPTFTIGQTGSVGSGTKSWVDVDIDEAPSQAVAPDDWHDDQAIALGNEPAAPGEATHATTSTSLAFTPQSRTRGTAKILTGGAGRQQTGTKSRAFAATELVVVEFQGHETRQQVMSALELALVRGDADNWGALDWVNLVATYITFAGLARSLGRSVGAGVLRGLAQTTLRAALVQGGKAFAQAAGKTGLRAVAAEVAVLQGFTFVESSRFELEKTAAGRAFLRVFDIGAVIYAAHGIRKLWASGVMQRLGKLGLAVIKDFSIAVKDSVIEAVDTMRALGQAFAKWKPNPGLVRSVAGDAALLGGLTAEESNSFHALFREARATIFGERAIGKLTGRGLSTDTATKLFEELQAAAKKYAEENPDTPQKNIAARAWTAVTRTAARIDPARAEEFLAEVKKLLESRTDPSVLHNFLVAVADLGPAQRLSLLREAQTLAKRAAITDDTLRTLAAKAAAGSIDLEWVNSLNLSDELMNALGGDKMTPWRLFKRAATVKFPILEDILRARAAKKIRGIAGELLAQRKVDELFGGAFKIVDSQVPMNGSIIDHTLAPTAGGGKVRALEVKAWHGDTWDAVLDAVGTAKKARTEAQQKLADMFDHLVRQLRNAKDATGRTPFLLTNMSDAALQRLEALFLGLKKQLVVNVKRYKEADLDAIVAEVTKGLGIQ